MDAAQHYEQRMAQFRSDSPPPGQIVLLGSSHFEWFDTDRFLPRFAIINRGIASDRLGIDSRGVLKRLQPCVFELQPAGVVFEGGVNDLGELWRNGEPSMQRIITAFREILQQLRDFDRKMPIIVLSVFPTRGRFADLNALVDTMNDRIHGLATRRRCSFLNLHPALANRSGQLREDFTEDGLHLNESGYQILADRLRPHLPRVEPV
jgi:lysophospholipase L1-like esterase